MSLVEQRDTGEGSPGDFVFMRLIEPASIGIEG